jgi:hypothetical protein
MIQKTLHNIADLYTSSLKEHGQTAQGVGWGDAEKHNIRFDQILYLFNNATGNISINDLGAGYGAFYYYLINAGYKISCFNAYDISQEMLNEAQQNLIDDCAHFYNKDQIDTLCDFSVASGIFNVRFQEDHDIWTNYILKTLHNLNDYSRKGFAFNILTSYVDWKDDKLYYADPCFFFDYCKKEFGQQVTLLHDYPLWEWTMIVRK